MSNEIRTRPLTPTEQKYTYAQSMQLEGQTGTIGHLRGDFATTGYGFYTTWFDTRPQWKSDEFKADLDTVINALREDKELLHNRYDMSAFARHFPESAIKGNYCTEYGFRVDTEKHAFLLRCNPTKGDYNFYCYCYVKEWLDKHIQKAKQGIRFIDPQYKELFRIPETKGFKLIKKIPRQNGKLETWSSHFIRQILDNPVYCGKIAYGRRTREKVKGTKNEYKQVHTDDYILEDGQHEGIVSAELWEKVRAKRIATGIKQPSKVGKDRSHLLTGVLKCPMCGSSMYTNKHAWTNKDGTYKEVYYYICGRNKQERGHHCDYKASLRKTDIEPLVIEAVKELVSDKYFAREIKSRIGIQTDTGNVDKEIANYESKLKEVDLNKARLEREIDNLPADARYRERKIHDMTLRLDGLYDTIVELEERIEDAKLRRSSIEMEAITLENVYKIMKNFGKLYAIMSDEEKKSVISYLIKEIQIYPNGESEMPLKSIEFNFPIYRDGKEVRKVLWERGNTVETICQLVKVEKNI